MYPWRLLDLNPRSRLALTDPTHRTDVSALEAHVASILRLVRGGGMPLHIAAKALPLIEHQRSRGPERKIVALEEVHQSKDSGLLMADAIPMANRNAPPDHTGHGLR